MTSAMDGRKEEIFYSAPELEVGRECSEEGES
jgi:hypothetical protein